MNPSKLPINTYISRETCRPQISGLNSWLNYNYL